MGVIKIEQLSRSILGLWQIVEPEEKLRQGIAKEDLDKIESFHQNKRTEFLATRQLMKAICQQHQIPYHGIQKDEFGKPHLINSDLHISVSHAHPMVACLIHKQAPCGVDIEKPRAQLNRIKKKFLSTEELAYCGDDLNLLCLHWCAKEALYKIYGRKQLIFAEELFIRSITLDKMNCEVITSDYQKSHELRYRRHDDYFIVMNV